MSLNTPEPTPEHNEHPATWPLVIADVKKGPWMVMRHLIDDMEERDAAGRAKYGTPLQPHNGRDSLKDAYQEALDLTVYLKNVQLEAGDSPFYVTALGLAARLRRALLKRDGR